MAPNNPAREYFAAEYQALLNSLRRTQGFGLFFVECEPRLAALVSQRLQTDWPRHTLVDLPLEPSVHPGNLLKALKAVELTHGEVDVILLRGLDAALTTQANQAIPPLLVQLNQQREVFRDRFSIRFVLFGSTTTITQLIRQAPDFFDWRSGLFRFPHTQG